MDQTVISDTFTWSNPEDTDHTITIKLRCSSVHFEVRYRHSNLAASPHLLAEHDKSMRLMWASADGNDEEIENSSKEICRLQIPFEKLIVELTTSVIRPADDYLDSFLYPIYLVLDAVAPSQQSTIVDPILRGQRSISSGHPLRNWQQAIKCFTSRQVRLLTWRYHPFLSPSNVLAIDSAAVEVACVFKSVHFNILRKLAVGEPWVYQQIEAAIKSKLLRPDIPVCRLYGVVVDDERDIPQHHIQVAGKEISDWNSESDGSDYEDENGDRDAPNHLTCLSGEEIIKDARNKSVQPIFACSSEGNANFGDRKRMVGLLLTYIENKGTLYDVAPWSDCSDTRRVRWAQDLEQVIRELHTAGIIWGDAKPQNLLVGSDDTLWVIDLDGGYTPSWVDEDKRESLEGDLQGVMRIKNWLLRCSERPVSRFHEQSGAN